MQLFEDIVLGMESGLRFTTNSGISIGESNLRSLNESGSMIHVHPVEVQYAPKP